jgi:hypothetical protein
MEVHTLEIDSSERDYASYPDPSDYVIDLKNRIYDIRKITLVSARIPNSQTLIHARNNTFSIDGTDIVVPNGLYTTGDVLAVAVRDAINEHFSYTVEYNSNLNSLEFTNDSVSGSDTFEFGDGTYARIKTGTDDTLSNLTTIEYTTPHQVFGFLPQNITVNAGETVTSGSINLEGPNSLVLRLSSGSDNFNKDIYIREPFYTSHILLNGPFMNFSVADDPVKHDFFSGPQKFIESLRLQFFYMSNGRLIPYDFRNQDHILKFEIQCNTGKFKSSTGDTVPDVGVLPPPISIPDFEDPYRWKQYVLISIIIFIGVFTLVVTRKRL